MQGHHLLPKPTMCGLQVLIALLESCSVLAGSVSSGPLLLNMLVAELTLSLVELPVQACHLVLMAGNSILQASSAGLLLVCKLLLH